MPAKEKRNDTTPYSMVWIYHGDPGDGMDGDSGKKSDNAARFTLNSTFRAALANEATAHCQASSIDDARSALGCPSSMCIRGLMGPCHSATYGAYSVWYTTVREYVAMRAARYQSMVGLHWANLLWLWYGWIFSGPHREFFDAGRLVGW